MCDRRKTKLKGKMYKAVVRPAVMHGSETVDQRMSCRWQR